jgi:hypothetical protein
VAVEELIDIFRDFVTGLAARRGDDQPDVHSAGGCLPAVT